MSPLRALLFASFVLLGVFCASPKLASDDIRFSQKGQAAKVARDRFSSSERKTDTKLKEMWTIAGENMIPHFKS